jgi:hypothetical protein
MDVTCFALNHLLYYNVTYTYHDVPYWVTLKVNVREVLGAIGHSVIPFVPSISLDPNCLTPCQWIEVPFSFKLLVTVI